MCSIGTWMSAYGKRWSRRWISLKICLTSFTRLRKSVTVHWEPHRLRDAQTLDEKLGVLLVVGAHADRLRHLAAVHLAQSLRVRETRIADEEKVRQGPHEVARNGAPAMVDLGKDACDEEHPRESRGDERPERERAEWQRDRHAIGETRVAFADFSDGAVEHHRRNRTDKVEPGAPDRGRRPDQQGHHLESRLCDEKPRNVATVPGKGRAENQHYLHDLGAQDRSSRRHLSTAEEKREGQARSDQRDPV